MARTYWPRVVDAELRSDLDVMGAVVIEGPKACGKTETALQVAASTIRLDVDAGAAQLADAVPTAVLDGHPPRLIDEWQMAPGLWNAIRRAVDARGLPGQFIVTGSASPADDARRHSGAGRFAHIRMRPMSLWEAGRSSGDVSLGSLLSGSAPAGHTDMAVADYVDAIIRGGWPQNLETQPALAPRFVRNYITDAVEQDIPLLTGTRHDPARLRRFLHAYAQVTAQPAALTTIASRVLPEADEPNLKRDTADAYRSAAERLMLVEDVPPWSPRLRSRTRLVATPKRHLADPSLAAGLLDADASRLLKDGETLGFLFESLVTRDIRVYAQAHDAVVHHYRERDGSLEADLVIERRDGTWTGIEVKLGGSAIDIAAANLRRIAERRIERPPAGLVVVTAEGYAYRRQDGVDVVPLGTLRP